MRRRLRGTHTHTLVYLSVCVCVCVYAHDWLGSATPLYANITPPLFNRFLLRHICVRPSLPPPALSRQPFDTVFAFECGLFPSCRCCFSSHASACACSLSRSVLFCMFYSSHFLYMKAKLTSTHTHTHTDVCIYFDSQEHQQRHAEAGMVVMLARAIGGRSTMCVALTATQQGVSHFPYFFLVSFFSLSCITYCFPCLSLSLLHSHASPKSCAYSSTSIPFASSILATR